jgi:hypothetical protein
MKKVCIVIALTSLLGITASAQTPAFEVFGDYSYIQFNPSVTGLQSRAFNGGGGGAQANFGKLFGIKGDFQGYGSTQWNVVVTTPLVTTAGTIPVGTYKSNGNMFTYLFGPVVGVHAKKFYVFSEVLFGGSNTNGYGNLTKAINAGGGTLTVSGTQHPFTMAFGGGLDFNVGDHFAIRLGELDYLLTRYTNPLTQTNNQNNFRYLGGVVYRFGGK